MMILATVLISVPVTAKDFVSASGERQLVVSGTLYDELFPEWENATHWQKQSVGFGFTAYGEMVTDKSSGSVYGVGLSYPLNLDDDEGIYPSEHIATPAISGQEWKYFPIEGWQLYWKYKTGTPAQLDPNWHVSMAIYGNSSSTEKARICVKPISTTIITNTSRLFVGEVVVHTYNSTLISKGLEPENFEIKVVFVFYKDTKKVASYWTVTYLASEAGEISAVFRRITDLDVDQKFQDGQTECFATFFANKDKASWQEGGESGDTHLFWTGCEY